MDANPEAVNVVAARQAAAAQARAKKEAQEGRMNKAKGINEKAKARKKEDRKKNQKANQKKNSTNFEANYVAYVKNL